MIAQVRSTAGKFSGNDPLTAQLSPIRQVYLVLLTQRMRVRVRRASPGVRRVSGQLQSGATCTSICVDALQMIPKLVYSTAVFGIFCVFLRVQPREADFVPHPQIRYFCSDISFICLSISAVSSFYWVVNTSIWTSRQDRARLVSLLSG